MTCRLRISWWEGKVKAKARVKTNAKLQVCWNCWTCWVCSICWFAGLLVCCSAGLSVGCFASLLFCWVVVAVDYCPVDALAC